VVESLNSGGYTLVICEKPDAARRVSEALSGGACRGSLVDGVTVFRFRSGSEDFVVCAAQGHLYSVSDPFGERNVYPVFDSEWYPLGSVRKGGASADKRIAVIARLSEGASRLVNACDFDAEGETIGFNIIRYACGGREEEALRARFSTLTREELVEAFRAAQPRSGWGLARAGRARHFVDFAWGINLSRALSQSALGSGRRYRTVSIGRVQGPTLKFLAERERAVQEFVPTPFWRVDGVFEGDGCRFVAAYSKERIETRSEAEEVRDACVGREGVVSAMNRKVVLVPPLPPFNVGDLQKEAYRAFGFSPKRTLQIAERLYLGALISYPRTGSQKLPPSIDFKGILRGLQGLAAYSKEAGELLGGELRPAEGTKVDQAHPAIYPTGERPRRSLEPSESKVYDMVVRRFLSVFAPPAKRLIVSMNVVVEGHEFKLRGSTTVYSGWMKYYGRYWSTKDAEVPRLNQGDRLKAVEVRVKEKFGERPARYNQSSLLEKMEDEKIGTKATRADTIATLLARGYAEGEKLVTTGLGLSVVEIMERHAPSIVTTELTRKVEEKLGAVEEEKEDGRDLIRETVRSVSEELVDLRSNAESVGREIEGALETSVATAYVLGVCPVCRTGRLRVVRSKKTGKRFAGCTNYSAGCRASAPLPQRGELRRTERPCQRCSWPVVYVVRGRSPWRLCINPNCSSKAESKG
jgi:DNA topoisomerase-1